MCLVCCNYLIIIFLEKSQQENRAQLDQSRIQSESGGSEYIFIDYLFVKSTFIFYIFILDLSKWTDPFDRKTQ